jgi:hypothetical protein
MALVFAAATTNKAQWTIQAAGVALMPWTIWAWIYPTTLTNGGGIFQQDNGAGTPVGYRDLSVRSTGQLDTEQDMTTTDMSTRSDTSNQITVNNWWFVAGSCTSSFVGHIYIGSLTVPVAEVTGYAVHTTGVGTPDSDSGGTGRWGNRGSTASNPLNGRIACGGYVSKALSVAELYQLQREPRVTPETVLYHQLGYLGTGTQPDWSGHAHTATITGATLGDHVPLPAPFGHGRRVAPYKVAATTTYQPWAHGGQDTRFAPLLAQ